MNKRYSTFFVISLFLFLLLHSACTEDKIAASEGGSKHTVRLTLSVSTTPIPETKAVVQRARPGSEAEAAGFSYELVSSNADTIATAVLTKAPTKLKNVYALLFTSAGAFNGRANLGIVTAGATTDIIFDNITNPDDTNCRLVIVANDDAAANNYSSSSGTGTFANFSDTYAQFQALTITNTISKDEDVPYAGSVTVNLADFGAESAVLVPLYRTLAKITLNNTFSITSGPSRSSITLYNAGTRRFATSGTDNYDGTGSTITTSYVPSTSGSNANSNTWYVGENIQSTVSGITSTADRNSTKAPTNACYIRIETGISKINITNPAIWQEYTINASGSFTYDIYLGRSSDVSDFSLRRHTNYTITSTVSGTLAEQIQLAANDGRVMISKSGGESYGLNIGKIAGSTSYTLLQPNTSGSTATDNVRKNWSDAFKYCSGLTLGGVSTGTWYLPSREQLPSIYTVWTNELKNRSLFAKYNAFNTSIYYWSSNDLGGIGYALYVDFATGSNYRALDTSNLSVRCIRDLP